MYNIHICIVGFIKLQAKMNPNVACILHTARQGRLSKARQAERQAGSWSCSTMPWTSNALCKGYLPACLPAAVSIIVPLAR